MQACWGWAQKVAPFDTGITRRRDKIYLQVLPSGPWAGGIPSGHTQSPAVSSLTKGLGPPREKS